MSRTLGPPAPGGSGVSPDVAASRAADQARDAASRAAVEIRDVEEIGDIRAVCRLFDEVWGIDNDDSLLQPGMLRALVHAGNYAAGAYVDDQMIGAVVAFLGRDIDGPYLHSHILGVSSSHRGSNIGFALKQHQRVWALERGMRKVTWTFDPLVRKNAYFNLQKLGADADTYLERFYGSMTDSVNAGDETDRLLVAWYLDQPRADKAASDHIAEPDVDDATTALSEECDVLISDWGSRIVCATPPDVVELRQSDPYRALTWRRALRSTLGEALSDGYHLAGFTKSGWYVLERA